MPIHAEENAAIWPRGDVELRLFCERFLDGEAAHDALTQAAYLAIAVYFLTSRHDQPAERAMEAALRACPAISGTAEGIDLFHCTVMLATLGAARATLHDHPVDASPAAVVRALVRSRYGDPAWTSTHWSPVRLLSEQARRGWLEPDLAPLDFPVLPPGIVVIDAHGPGVTATVAGLLVEYQEALGIDLGFQGFTAELAALPGEYAPPAGALLIAYADGAVAGCCGVRPLGRGACELKRMWVRPRFRNRGIGQILIGESVDRARSAGHDRMLLDTLSDMTAARALYLRSGFAPVPPYNDNPLPGTIWLGRPIVQPVMDQP